MSASYRRAVWIILAVFLAMVVLQTAAVACPTCKESLAQNDPAHKNVVRGYFWSILFMMSMPYVILGSLAAMFWWQVRKAKQQKILQGAASTAVHVPREAREPVEV